MKTTTSYQKTDVFPKKLSPSVLKLSEYPVFGSLVGNNDVKYFCLYMSEENRIYYQKRRLSDKVNRTFADHGRQTKVCKQFRPDAVKWLKVIRKFRALPVEVDGKNLDTRTGFKIGNDFLVKAHFTFGQRKVQPGTAHVVQTLAIPILLFLRRRDCRDVVEKGRFPYKSLHRYDMRVLEANSCHRIPPGVVYILFTLQKNFFRVDVVNEKYKIPFDYVDPVKTPVRLRDLYNEPVATPFIEELEDEEMSETYRETDDDDDARVHFSSGEGGVEEPSPSAASGEEVPHVYSEEFNNFYNEFFQPLEQQSFQTPMAEDQPQEIFQPPASEPSVSQTQQQQQQQQHVFMVIQDPPPILQRSVVRVTAENFVAAYGNMKRKEMGPPKERIVSDESWNPEPVDLTKQQPVEKNSAATGGPKDFVDLTMTMEEGELAAEMPKEKQSDLEQWETEMNMSDETLNDYLLPSPNLFFSTILGNC